MGLVAIQSFRNAKTKKVERTPRRLLKVFNDGVPRVERLDEPRTTCANENHIHRRRQGIGLTAATADLRAITSLPASLWP